MNLGLRQSLLNNKNESIPNIFKKIKWLDTNYPSSIISTNIPAYILTDITGISGDKLFIQIDCIHRVTSGDRSINGEWNFLIGAEYTDNESNNIKIRRNGRSYSNNQIYLCGTRNESTIIGLNYNTPYTVILNGSQLLANPGNMQLTLNPYANKTTRRLGIGGCELVKVRSDGYYRVWKGLLGRCIVKYDNNLIGDFIPVLNTQTNIYGYYDLIQQKFYSSETDIQFKDGGD